MADMERKTLTDLAEDYIWELQCAHGEGARGRWKNEASRVRRLAAWYDKTKRAPKNLDAAAIRGYLFGVRDMNWGGDAKGLSNGSFNNAVLYIKKFVQWLEGQGVVKSSEQLCRVDRRKQVKNEKHRIDRDQIRTMLANAEDPWERWVLIVGLETAGRVSELVRLQWRHLRVPRRKLKWYRPKTQQYDELPAMPLLLREATVFKTYVAEQGIALTDEDYLIPARRGKYGVGFTYTPNAPASVDSLADTVKRHVLQFFSAEELHGEAAHVLRRSAARELYETFKERGVPDPLRIVQAWLGHASITQTEDYIGIRRDRDERDALMDGLDWLAVSDENVVDLEAVRRGAQDSHRVV